MAKKKTLIGSITALLALAAVGFGFLQNNDLFPKQETQQSEVSTPSAKDIRADELAQLTYQGIQTIEVNQNIPEFSEDDLSLENGAWEAYGDLDHLNRATSAEAMLNQSLMPTEKRGDISSVKPTGWRNKQLPNGKYLYNRTHLIGFALAGENANWKNLITGTSQLNNPEMLRLEMDINYYLKQDKNHYVRYSVTPIYRDDELVARGVQMQAQSIGDDTIQFNYYIFNIQDGVTINYADGSSEISNEDMTQQENATSSEKNTTTATSQNSETEEKQKEYVDQQGNGLIKGSRSGIYHLPGSKYYDDTTNPKEWFKTIAEAEAAGYRAPK